MDVNVCELTDEIYKTLFSTGYAVKILKSDSGVLLFNKILNDKGYTCDGEESLKRKHFSTELPPERVAKIESRIVQ